jgi:hypothetical protein
MTEPVSSDVAQPFVRKSHGFGPLILLRETDAVGVGDPVMTLSIGATCIEWVTNKLWNSINHIDLQNIALSFFLLSLLLFLLS